MAGTAPSAGEEEPLMEQGNPTIPAGLQSEAVRSAFMGRVYTRLVIGVAAFVLLEAFLFTSGIAYAITAAVVQTSWLLVLGGFMIVSWLANSIALRASGPGSQWGGYLLLVAANALIFAPMLVIAELQVPGVVATAGQYAVVAFIILSVIAHRSARDFTWLGASLRWFGVLALAGIVIAVLTGASLGSWFSLAMIGFAGAAILYETQVILREVPPGRETVAAMSLFSSLALLFWYLLRLFMDRR
jgi:FtsH-binding integral membrane protein